MWRDLDHGHTDAVELPVLGTLIAGAKTGIGRFRRQSAHPAALCVSESGISRYQRVSIRVAAANTEVGNSSGRIEPTPRMMQTVAVPIQTEFCLRGDY